MASIKKILLCGNPNTGKTTLFNMLTKSKEKASNWHGVTVSVKEKSLSINDKEFVVCDLPGIYSLEGISEEEKLSASYILEHKEDIIVCVVDVNNLKRNLLLAVELKEICKNLILAVNFAKEIKDFSSEKLEQNLGVKVIPIDATNNKSVEKLKNAIYEVYEQNKKEKATSGAITNYIIEKLDNFEEKVKDKFENIDNVLEKSGYNKISAYGQSKIDKVLLNPVLSPIIFIFVMGIVFFITFGFIGQEITGVFQVVIDSTVEWVVNFLGGLIKNDKALIFIKDGLLNGVVAVLGFLPQIILLSMCFSVLEDFGYLSRVAFMFDGFLKKFGLTGRAIFSLLLGFGCTTSAVITTRNLNSESLRKRAVLSLARRFSSMAVSATVYVPP